jgi:anti-anti-sigma factor
MIEASLPMESQMKYALCRKAGTMEVTMEGRFTFADHDEFRNFIREILKENQEQRFGQCRIDMGPMIFIDSTALGMLVLANDAASKAGFSLSLRNARGQVRTLLDRSEFYLIMRVEDALPFGSAPVPPPSPKIAAP